MIHGKTKDLIVNRLARAEGHLRKVRKMVEEEAYCPDVIHQSQAVQAALKKVDEIILESHLYTCVLSELGEKPSQRRKLTKEVVEVFKKQNK